VFYLLASTSSTSEMLANAVTECGVTASAGTAYITFKG